MPGPLLLDAGPLVAYLYPRDAYHDWAVQQFAAADAPFVTCEPALTEACFLTARNGQRPSRVLELLARGIIRVGLNIEAEATAIAALVQRYTNVPISLADACLVRLGEMTRRAVVTLDSDFTVYRTSRGQPLEVVMPHSPFGLHEP